MKSAERRNALKKALGYLDTAERIDGLNPDVKKARLRLLAAAAVRHLKQKKTHLVRKDIAAIELLPQSQKGDRPAFSVALKSICALIDEDESELLRLSRQLTTRLGYSLTAEIVLRGLLRSCGLSDRQDRLPEFSGDSLEANELAAAVARGCQIGDDVGIDVAIPPAHEEKLMDFFAADGSSQAGASIRVIAEAALKNGSLELAYVAAGAGLLQPGAAAARFLLLRARSLPPWEMDRKHDCLTAAIELARRDRDLDLIDEAVELRRNGNGFRGIFSLFGFMIDNEHSSMETEELSQVLEREKAARDYPSGMVDDFLYDVDDGVERKSSECRYCDAKNCRNRDAPYEPLGLEIEIGDEDNDGDDFRNFNGILDEVAADLPPELTSLIKKVFAKHGKDGPFPEQGEVMRKDPWLADQLLQELRRADADGILLDFDPKWMPGWLPRF
jgi:hypothetical protein